MGNAGCRQSGALVGQLVRIGAVLAVAVLTVAVPTGSHAGAQEANWGFEQVTPENKAGGNVTSVDTFRSSEDGQKLLYTATAPFEGAPAESAPMYVRYLGGRHGALWRTMALDPPFDVFSPGYLNYIMGVVGSSVDLSHVVVSSTRALADGAIEGGGNVYLRDTQSGRYQLVAASANPAITRELSSPLGSTQVSYVGPGGDGVMFVTGQRLTGDAPTDGSAVLYGWTPERGLYVVSRLPESEGGGVVGGASSGIAEDRTRRTVPSRGALRRVYFQAQEAGMAAGVYLRDGDESIPVSRSEISGVVQPASIVASSDNGDYALIETFPDDPPLTHDTPVDPAQFRPAYLYRYDRGTRALEFVGATNPSGFPAGQVLQMSEDGQSVIFQSGFELTPGAVPGASNIYVWRTGTTRLVSSPELFSGANFTSTFMRLLSRNGRYFAFTDNSQSSFARAGADPGSPICKGVFGMTGLCFEVFLYDLETGKLSCASCRPVGVGQNGASGDPGLGDLLGYIRMDQHQPQNISNDGTVWFTSANDLLPVDDSNGAQDVYASRNGELRLVSRGRPGISARFLDATPDGRVVFISTNDAIAPGDVDEEVDIYATGPAVEPLPSASEPSPDSCNGSDCRPMAERDGRGSGIPGSILAPGSPPTRGVPRSVVRIVRSRFGRTSARITVRVSGPGRISARGRGIASTSRGVSRSGVYVLNTRLKPSARAKRDSRKSVVSVRVRFTPPFGKSVDAKARKVVS